MGDSNKKLTDYLYYQDDWATIYCGDCLEVIPLIDSPFDLILTDVPYWNMDKLDKSKGKYKKTGDISKKNKKSKLSSFNTKLQDKILGIKK